MSNLRNGSTVEKRCNRMGWIGMLVTLGIVFGDIGTSPLYVMKASSMWAKGWTNQ